MKRPSLLLALPLALLLTGCTAARIAQPEVLPHFQGFAEAADGWRLALFRVPPAPGAPDRGLPVLLVHGTATNRQTFMLRGSDFAGFLAADGFDVWVAELRGDRTSRPPDGRTWSRGDWDVDRLAEQDVPALLDHIAAATGHDQVLWVGHSLGGILGYVTLQSERAAAIGGLVAVGSPAAFTHPTDATTRMRGLRSLAPKHGQVGMRSLAGLAKGSLRLDPDGALFHTMFNSENLGVDAAATFATEGIENIGTGVLDQLTLWAERGHLVSADGTTDWTAGLAQVQAPALFVAGSVDQIAPSWTVRAAYEATGSADKSWLTLGRGWGQRHEYGHADLFVGDWAFEEVFPVLRDWLEAHSRAD